MRLFRGSVAVGVALLLGLGTAGAVQAASAPGAPTGVAAAPASTTSVTITWSPPADADSTGVTGYGVSRDGVDSTGQGSYSTSVAATVRSFTMTRLIPGTTYNFTLAAFNASGGGPAVVTPVALPAAAPPVPTSFVVTQTTANAVALSWQPPAQTNGSPITGYRVARDGTDSAGQGAYSTTLAATATTFTLTKLVVGSTYTLSVQAINALGTGTAASLAYLIRPGWVARTTPALSGSTAATLTSVSCFSASACVAVGNSQTTTLGPLTETWNGSAWTVRTLPLPTGTTFVSLDDVSCSAATACLAVGSVTTTAGATVPLSATWNGTTWTSRTGPVPTGATSSSFAGVSCTSATACVAVGNAVGTTIGGPPLAASWNGSTWTLRPPANPATPTGATRLTDVSCTAANACTAVGSYFVDEDSLSISILAERWNGTSWAVQATPTTQYPRPGLQSVSCFSATVCTAVGYTLDIDDDLESPVAIGWNGSKWTAQAVPKPTGDDLGALSGISCRAANACTAVGDGDSSNATGPSTQTAYNWNGTVWSLQSLPVIGGSGGNVLATEVSCSSTTACTTVGRNGSIPFTATR